MSPINKIKKFLSEKWDAYQKQKKADALYNKLHKYDGTKYTQKEWIKTAQNVQKEHRKKTAPGRKPKEEKNDKTE